MAKTQDIIRIIENIAPLDTAEVWDNSGWQINLHNENSKKIMSCLTVTEDVLELAVQLGCDLIIAHHPLIFSPVKKLENPLYIKAIQNGIQIYSSHTCFDKAKGGTTDMLAQKAELQDIVALNDYVRCGRLPFELPLEKFLAVIKISLDLGTIKVVNKNAKPLINTVALCAGSGSEFIEEVKHADIYITSDIKYHAALEVKDMVLLDIGHFHSEKFFAQKIKEIIETELKNLNEVTEVIVANEKPAWIYV